VIFWLIKFKLFERLKKQFMEEEKQYSGDEGPNPYADGPVEEMKVPG
jgi:hypothetical protein